MSGPAAADARSGEDLAHLRVRAREWLAQNAPTRADVMASDDYLAAQRRWLATLRAGGWAAMHWAPEWGGPGLSLLEQAVFLEELALADAPRLSLSFVALNHVYATLTAHGSEEQCRRWLPAILEGEIWCQGFSEPGAGSDLAGLRCAAPRRGDAFVVSGQKVWSSYAADARWCLLLARSDPNSQGSKGLSMLAVDMTAPGVTVRRIVQATGGDEFCEVFFDEAAVPVDNLIGAEGAGWEVARATLSAERGQAVVELAARLRRRFRTLLEAARRGADERGGAPIDHDDVRQELAQLGIELDALDRTCKNVLLAQHLGAAGAADSSMVKIMFSELLQRVMRCGTRVAGWDTLGPAAGYPGSAWESGNWALDFVGSWEWTIGGGTNEVLRTLVGERGLGLPRETRR